MTYFSIRSFESGSRSWKVEKTSLSRVLENWEGEVEKEKRGGLGKEESLKRAKVMLGHEGRLVGVKRGLFLNPEVPGSSFSSSIFFGFVLLLFLHNLQFLVLSLISILFKSSSIDKNGVW